MADPRGDGATAVACVTGQLRGVCSPHHVWFLLHRVLPALASRVDLLLVVPAGADCERAAQLFPNASELLCVADRPLSPAEGRWVAEGPRLCWDRERYVLQLRLLRRCGELVRRRLAEGARYARVLRARADVLWERFPPPEGPGESGGGAGAGALQLAWAPLLQWQGFADNFALGPPGPMLRYLSLYDFVLAPERWRDYDLPEGDKVWRRLWAHECNYPELVLERFLALEDIPLAYTWEVCFSRMRACGQPIEACGPREPLRVAASGAFADDLAPWREAVLLEGREVLADQTFPRHYEHDAVLAAKLVELFHREHLRLGRPPKIADLGCGRGTLVAELRLWHLPAVGVDGNPLLTAVIPEVGMVADVAANLSFTLRTMHPRCNFRPHLGRYSPGMDFEAAEQTALGESVEDPRLQDPGRPMRWVAWVNYLMSRCCLQLACVGFGTDGRLKYGLRPRDDWVASPGAWLYVKEPELPALEHAMVEVPGQRGPAVLPAAPRGDTMDWVLGLDVGAGLPARARPGFLRSVANLAGEGAVLSWGAGAEAEAEAEAAAAGLRRLGLRRDPGLEEELRLFAGIAFKGHLRRTLMAFRRARSAPAPCDARPVGAAPGCTYGVTYGCLDGGRIWVRRGCGGTFRRGGPEERDERDGRRPGGSPSTVECRTFSPAAFEYEECDLPSPRRGAVPDAAPPRSPPLEPLEFGSCSSQSLEAFHGRGAPSVFDSVDPLTRPREPVWHLAPCGVLAAAFRLFRLLLAPAAHFLAELRRPWRGEWRLVLLSCDWRAPTALGAAAWLPELLRRSAARARALAPGLGAPAGPLAAAAALLRRCPSGRCRRGCAALRRARGLLAAGWRRLGEGPLHRLLLGGAGLWRTLEARARRAGAPLLPVRLRGRASVRASFAPPRGGGAAARYLHRLAALPH